MHEFKVGDRVRFKGQGYACHKKLPKHYPEDGTIGTVSVIDGDGAIVQWPEGSTSGNDMWWAWFRWLELVEE